VKRGKNTTTKTNNKTTTTNDKEKKMTPTTSQRNKTITKLGADLVQEGRFSSTPDKPTTKADVAKLTHQEDATSTEINNFTYKVNNELADRNAPERFINVNGNRKDGGGYWTTTRDNTVMTHLEKDIHKKINHFERDREKYENLLESDISTKDKNKIKKWLECNNSAKKCFESHPDYAYEKRQFEEKEELRMEKLQKRYDKNRKLLERYSKRMALYGQQKS